MSEPLSEQEITAQLEAIAERLSNLAPLDDLIDTELLEINAALRRLREANAELGKRLRAQLSLRAPDEPSAAPGDSQAAAPPGFDSAG
jgi:hypothetical protein